VIRSLLMGLVLASAALTAQAQFRALPADAKRATLVPVQGMTVELDGKRVELAAGAQVRDARNLIVLPAALPKSALVKYQLGADGRLQRAWILSPQEAAQPDRAK
jgi:hypothetical protein